MRGLILVVAKLVGRIEVIGAEKIPADGAFVLAPVHRSNVDFALTVDRHHAPDALHGQGLASGSRSRSAASCRCSAPSPCTGARADRDALQGLHRHRQRRQPAGDVPRGHPLQRARSCEELFDGTAYVAAKAGVPIIPVGIGGTEAMMPKGAKLLRPTRSSCWSSATRSAPPARTEKGRVPRSAVADLTERLHVELQDALRRRPGPRRPPQPAPVSAPDPPGRQRSRRHADRPTATRVAPHGGGRSPPWSTAGIHVVAATGRSQWTAEPILLEPVAGHRRYVGVLQRRVALRPHEQRTSLASTRSPTT